MKPLVTFVLGALTGAFLLWFGFGRKVLTVGNELIIVNRFTGKASQVFISRLEEQKLQMDEVARLEALAETPTSAAEPQVWRELTEAEIKRLEFKWRMDGSNILIEYHNPFEKEVRVEKVLVQVPAQGGQPAISREYQMEYSICRPMSDSSERLTSMHIPYHLFKPAAESTASPAEPRPASATITPVRILMRK